MKRNLRLPVWAQDLDLPMTAKLLIAEIESLHRNKGCFASNAYFAELLGIQINTVAKNISLLRKKGYLETVSFDGRKRVLAPIGVGEGRSFLSGEGSFGSSSRSDLDENPTPLLVHKEDTRKITYKRTEIDRKNLNSKLTRFSPSTRKMILEQIVIGEDGICALPERASPRMKLIWDSLQRKNVVTGG
ncbi:helix-turn-helix domain-containing protein [Leptospira idonii]|uniref:Helix-turn-helix domain-containing protein n=1 Tax=Leptospira idonii TaxID=1193500 RepID=A0A4R9M4T9_9LEPT|nr:helix-turn-helix domain-containing protein [Leptospira idonii]TGN20259.1 helix-turn-helix domain-containing protein [Leptospira idonii]